MLLAHTLLAGCYASAADIISAASGYAAGLAPTTGTPATLTVRDLTGHPVLTLPLAADHGDPAAQRAEVWGRREEIGARLRGAVSEDWRLVSLSGIDDPQEALDLQPGELGPEATAYHKIIPDATEEDLCALAHLQLACALDAATFGVDDHDADAFARGAEAVEEFVRERNNWALLPPNDLSGTGLGRRHSGSLRECVVQMPGPFLRRHDAKEVFARTRVNLCYKLLGSALKNVRSVDEARALLNVGEPLAVSNLMGRSLKVDQIVSWHVDLFSTFHPEGPEINEVIREYQREDREFRARRDHYFLDNM